jgi:hypothetical protein
MRTIKYGIRLTGGIMGWQRSHCHDGHGLLMDRVVLLNVLVITWVV